MSNADERWVLRAEDQRALDERAVSSDVEQDALMESAGTSAAEWILGRPRPRRAVVLAGPGVHVAHDNDGFGEGGKGVRNRN